MPVAAVPVVRQQIAAGQLDPLYLIIGDDEVEKAALAGEFAEAIDEGLRAFNLHRFYAGESDADEILAAARTVPMMAPRRLVIVLRAERLLAPKRETDATIRDLAAVEAYIGRPEPTTTLVLTASDLDERRRLVKALLKNATVVKCGGVSTVAEAERWVRARMTEAQVPIAADAVRLLVARTGPDVRRLRADVERLLLYVLDRKRVTADDVRELIGPAVSQDDWAVARAIEQGDHAAALRELALALDAGAVPYMVVGQLGWVARTKVPPSRVGAAVEAVFRTDLGLKRSGGDPRVLLERLVVELCDATRPPRGAGSRGMGR